MNNNKQRIASRAIGKPDVWRGTLSVALAWTIAYVACVGFSLAFSQWAMHPAWQAWLPGFEWLSFGVSCWLGRSLLSDGLYSVACRAGLQRAGTETAVTNG